MTTTVENVRGLSPDAYYKRPDRFYVGRLIRLRNGVHAGQVWQNSGFGNPLKFHPDDDAEAKRKKMLMFVYMLINGVNRHGLLRDDFYSMPGKKLGCWCMNWNAQSINLPLCHACYLARLVDRLNPELGKSARLVVTLSGCVEYLDESYPEERGIVVIRNGDQFSTIIRGELEIDFDGLLAG